MNASAEFGAGIGAGADVLRFRVAIERQLGLDFGDEKLDLLSGVLRTRLQKTGALPQVYLAELETRRAPQEWRLLGEMLTISETYFFRHHDQMKAFAEVAVPARIEQRGPLAKLAILSAGCASGEEAYSLAIELHEHGLGGAAAILGVDISQPVIAKARAARYTAWSLRATPEPIQQRWFRRDGRDFVLDAAIRDTANFEHANLADSAAGFWRDDFFDVIFCRNMLMYFSPASARALIERLTRALAPGGYLFMGHAETLRGLSDDFHLCHTHDCFYYRRRTEDDEPAVNAVDWAWPALPVAATTARNTGQSAAWVDTIRRSAERIQELGQKSDSPASAARIVAPNLSDARALLQQERFVDALNALTTLPAEAADDADALLLKAVLQVHTGRPDQAEIASRRLLAINDLDAGAHYVLALCREAVGDNDGSIEHFQTAAYLNPHFAMPHVHLGLLARRTGEHDTARRELAQAVTLLQQEDVSRLLLFGGGFSREALLALCNAELTACGERHGSL